ncbi:hypothetical protein [Micromonospora sp. NPDC047730]|uniref:hypothetical protein n=1 Tax=Micromonospora sp. NPDC047730 TaxID=3364253 RepID=UPI0037102E3C
MIKAGSKVLALIVGALVIPLSLIGCTESEGSGGRTEIVEIENTAQVFGRQGEAVTVKRHYMILNPPKDLTELKELVEGYSKDHPIDGEIEATPGRNRVFDVSFYRESEDLPRGWQPDEGYLNTDRLEHHKNDLVASVSWSDVDPKKNYDLYEKSKKGKIVKRMRFIEDQLVE